MISKTNEGAVITLRNVAIGCCRVRRKGESLCSADLLICREQYNITKEHTGKKKKAKDGGMLDSSQDSPQVPGG